MNASPIDFAEDLTANVNPEKLSMIINTAREMSRRAKAIEELESKLKEAQESYRQIAEGSLPALLEECGLQELPLGNGWTVVRDPFLRANLPAPSTIEKADDAEAEQLTKRLQAGIEWLTEQQGRDIVQETIVVKLKKGQNEQAKAIQQLIDSLKLKGERGAKVHPATLTKFIKEKIEAGVEVPFDVFAVHTGFAAKLIPPPTSKKK